MFTASISLQDFHTHLRISLPRNPCRPLAWTSTCQLQQTQHGQGTATIKICAKLMVFVGLIWPHCLDLIIIIYSLQHRSHDFHRTEAEAPKTDMAMTSWRFKMDQNGTVWSGENCGFSMDFQQILFAKSMSYYDKMSHSQLPGLATLNWIMLFIFQRAETIWTWTSTRISPHVTSGCKWVDMDSPQKQAWRRSSTQLRMANGSDTTSFQPQQPFRNFSRHHHRASRGTWMTWVKKKKKKTRATNIFHHLVETTGIMFKKVI